MALLFTNNASGLLSLPIVAGDSVLNLNTNEGSLFPSPSGGDTFYGTLEDDVGNLEIVSCTSRSADTFTIIRAQEGTTAQDFPAGARFEIRTTAATLNAMQQTVTAAADFAPKTHFNDNGTTAEQLHAGNVGTETVDQGVGVRRQPAQSTTTLSLRDSTGTEEASIATNATGGLILDNNQVSGTYTNRAKNSAGSPTDLITADPDGATVNHYAGDPKTTTAAHGVTVRGSSAVAPYNSHVRLYDKNGTEYLAAIGMVDNINELRITSEANGYPVGLYGADAANGTVRAILVGDPDGPLSGYHNGAKKFETSATGLSVTGVVTQSSAATQGAHLVNKSYVDDALAASAFASTLAANGYVVLPGGLTINWGQTSGATIAGNTSEVQTFSKTFTAVYACICTSDYSVGIVDRDAGVASLSTTGFNYFNNGTQSITKGYWIAVGVS